MPAFMPSPSTKRPYEYGKQMVRDIPCLSLYGVFTLCSEHVNLKKFDHLGWEIPMLAFLKPEDFFNKQCVGQCSFLNDDKNMVLFFVSTNQCWKEIIGSVAVFCYSFVRSVILFSHSRFVLYCEIKSFFFLDHVPGVFSVLYVPRQKLDSQWRVPSGLCILVSGTQWR